MNKYSAVTLQELWNDLVKKVVNTGSDSSFSFEVNKSVYEVTIKKVED